MADTIGISLESTVVRAVTRARGTLATLEVPWDPANPDEMVQALRTKFGTAGAIAIAVGLGFLETARPELPPLSAADATTVLLRDADRYFPVEKPVAVAMREHGAVAFATDSDALNQWVGALERFAPVRAVFAAPDALASALGQSTDNAAAYLIDAAPGRARCSARAGWTCR